MSFFRDNIKSYRLQSIESPGLRSCQLGAIWALKSQQTLRNKKIASLISMPTGTGKTAVMLAACFELKFKKVLIVVSSTILRRQLKDQFTNLDILKDIGCIDDGLGPVNVYEVTKRVKDKETWVEVLRKHDVIVAHPNSISPYYMDVEPIPADLLDAIFIDEAHHEPAPTWRDLNSYYQLIPRFFFTATPYRQDRQRIKAKLLYHYSLEEALADGVLRAVDLVPLNAGFHKHASDSILIEKAFEIFNLNNNNSILVRTDSIKDAEALLTLYRAQGFNIDVIHNKRSSNVNQGIINKVRCRELDGLICIGMASEGLDIPNLNIAVLHSTPRSIPYTIQFLGRISRKHQSQQANAKLIANIDEVKKEVIPLYKANKSWGVLLPQIAEKKISSAKLYQSTSIFKESFQLPELSVYFSATIYELPTSTILNDIDLDDHKSKEGVEIAYYEQADKSSPITIVTSWPKPIEWASNQIYIENMLDVHIIYVNHSRNLLFELTTSMKAFKNIKSAMYANLQPLPHNKLYKVLSKFPQNDYLMVGMKNAATNGPSHPAYKTFIGTSVQSSVRASDGRIFGIGHALLKFENKSIWGVGVKNGRVWSVQRGTASEFGEWCEKLSRLINDGPVVNNLPGLSFLMKSETIDRVHELPIAIIPDSLFYRALDITISKVKGGSYHNIVPDMLLKSINKTTGVVSGEVVLGEDKLSFEYSVNEIPFLKIEGASGFAIRVDRYNETLAEGNIEEVFNRYLPSLVMPDGTVIIGRNKLIPNKSIEKLPEGLWISKNWEGCNIRAEAYKSIVIDNEPDVGKPVINHVADLYKPLLTDSSDLIFLDDGANEIADIIVVDAKLSVITFVHCKYSGSDAPGCRKSDCDELFAQAMRSIHWVSSPNLFERLNDRLNNAKKSKIIFGKNETFENIAQRFSVNEWSYKIVLAQPGFKIDKVSDRNRPNNNVYELAVPVYERIIGTDASMEVWGS
ncbi:DEAD/DEAH box helicase [Cobetia crustatorum]|uniref:DEAD/DEAH box helicase n=1 Tax=Cobetia crustatorum TaxID=553385 RepID=A0A558HKB0_9GAMM|nr:DEAD/DEAH box helicase family protein [Cobetia crustatorum]TVU69575.1 DEAD/DEAH box helicase [Cobetia crustatorum]